MAAATTKKQQPASTGEPAAVVDPMFEWTEKAGGYVLRLALPGFRKDDIRVQVVGAGRLTVRGTRTGTAASLYKVFQLPSAAGLDDIAGRFEAGVLTLTMPKRASSNAGTGVSVEEIAAKPPQGKDLVEEKVGDRVAKPKEEIAKDELASKIAMDEEEEAKKAQHMEEDKKEVKPKALETEAIAAAPHKPAKKPEATTGTKFQPEAAVAPAESLAERVRRRGEEEGANATSAKRARTDGEKKATPACVGWKERVQGELKVLTDMKWADSLVEAARKNKEVVAIGVAAFSLGILVSQKLSKK